MWRGFNLDRQMVLGSMGVGVEAVRRAAGEHRARTATDLAPPRHALSGDRKSRAPRDGHSTIPGSLLPGGWPQKVVYGFPIYRYILTGDSTLQLFRGALLFGDCWGATVKKVTEEEPFKEEELPVSQDISFRTSFHFLRGIYMCIHTTHPARTQDPGITHSSTPTQNV